VSPLEIATLRRKLSRMVEDLSLLQPLAGLSADDWRADVTRRDAGERRLQTCIEAALDVNAHLLVSLGHPAPADGYQSFLDLADRTRIIPRDLATKLAPSAGLRNRLVHQYDKLDDELVLQGLRDAVARYPEYITNVSAYVDQVEGGSA
jgi:uncharacterized protein YutE (UPF0331/DUF86 family)